MQNFLHIRSLRIGGPNRIVAFRQRDIPVELKIDNRLGFTGKAMNMTRWMIVRIDDKSNAAEPQRAHEVIITQATIGLVECFCLSFDFTPGAPLLAPFESGIAEPPTRPDSASLK